MERTSEARGETEEEMGSAGGEKRGAMMEDAALLRGLSRSFALLELAEREIDIDDEGVKEDKKDELTALPMELIQHVLTHLNPLTRLNLRLNRKLVAADIKARSFQRVLRIQFAHDGALFTLEPHGAKPSDVCTKTIEHPVELLRHLARNTVCSCLDISISPSLAQHDEARKLVELAVVDFAASDLLIRRMRDNSSYTIQPRVMRLMPQLDMEKIDTLCRWRSSLYWDLTEISLARGDVCRLAHMVTSEAYRVESIALRVPTRAAEEHLKWSAHVRIVNHFHGNLLVRTSQVAAPRPCCHHSHPDLECFINKTIYQNREEENIIRLLNKAAS